MHELKEMDEKAERWSKIYVSNQQLTKASKLRMEQIIQHKIAQKEAIQVKSIL